MHCVLLGVGRQLLRLWLNKCHHEQLWYIGDRLHELDSRLCRIKPPNEIQRTPRSLELTLKFWKGYYYTFDQLDSCIHYYAHYSDLQE